MVSLVLQRARKRGIMKLRLEAQNLEESPGLQELAATETSTVDSFNR